ncbi:MAG: hypothetical protein N3F63_03500 [Thermoplasmata archaeon]|nr:hypothetical protein [Thermoplasmata archaeon]
MYVDFSVASIIGIIPAIVLLYNLLKKYERPYVEFALFDFGRVGLAFIVGLFAGVVVGVARYVFYEVVTTSQIVEAVILMLLFFPFFEELLKLIILNTKFFHRKFDTVFYGISLGTSIGLMSFVSLALIMLRTTDLGSSPHLVGVLLLVAMNFIFINAFTGSVIAYGVQTGKIWGHLLRAVLFSAINNFLLFPFYRALPTLMYLFLVFALIYSLFTLYLVERKVIPSAIPDKVKKEIREWRKKHGGN